MRWVGVACCAGGLLAFGLAWSSARETTEARRVATEQASYVQGTCTITDAEPIEWRHDTRDDTTRGTTIEATFTVHAPKGDVPNVTYRYSDTYWNDASAKTALGSTHVRGSKITCFFDASDPEKAVLVRRGMPAPPGTSPWVFGSIFGVPLLLLGVIALFVKPDGKRRSED